MKNNFLIFAGLILTSFFFTCPAVAADRFFEVQSIDTMKYSRDLAREKLHDASFDTEINTQIQKISQTGATHVAIGTPYDAEFLPFLTRWVNAARKYNLKIWFRGNWSGWEGWNDYSRIDRQTHLAKTQAFILDNPDLFEDGDIFTACPECEFGGPGDPRQTGDVNGFRKFIIDEFYSNEKAFAKINKKVVVNYQSMNTDVARLIMDPETTKVFGGLIVIDHYVKSPQQLGHDIKDIAEKSNAKVILGEFGAPIPDIHGEMTDLEQAQWVEDVMKNIVSIKELAGVNYWVNRGGSTEIWNDANEPHPAADILTSYFKPQKIDGAVTDELNRGISQVEINTSLQSTQTDWLGNYSLLFVKNSTLKFSKKGYQSLTVNISANDNLGKMKENFMMKPQQPSFLYQGLRNLKKFLESFFKLTNSSD
jgi:hypothetical protein